MLLTLDPLSSRHLQVLLQKAKIFVRRNMQGTTNLCLEAANLGRGQLEIWL